MDIERVVEDTAVNLLKLAVVRLPSDVKDALQRAYKDETSEAGKVQLEAILKDIVPGIRELARLSAERERKESLQKQILSSASSLKLATRT